MVDYFLFNRISGLVVDTFSFAHIIRDLSVHIFP